MDLVEAQDLLQKELGPTAILEGCDFRPHFDGYLINVAKTVHPLATREKTKELLWEAIREITTWVVQNRSRFSPEDRFQLFCGWAEGVRPCGRQLLKWGGVRDDLDEILSLNSLDEFLERTGEHSRFRNWDVDVSFG